MPHCRTHSLFFHQATLYARRWHADALRAAGFNAHSNPSVHTRNGRRNMPGTVKCRDPGAPTKKMDGPSPPGALLGHARTPRKRGSSRDEMRKCCGRSGFRSTPFEWYSPFGERVVGRRRGVGHSKRRCLNGFKMHVTLCDYNDFTKTAISSGFV